MDIKFVLMVLAPSFVIPLACIYNYLKNDVAIITIEYAGGKIGFDKSWFTEREIEEFQRLIRLAKDKAVEESDNAVAIKLQEALTSTTVQPVNGSDNIVEQLEKLGVLLEKGIISREEFESLKKELI